MKCHYISLLTGLSSIFKDSSLQVRSPHREYNTGSSTTVYLTILQDRLHTVSSSLYICVCTPQDLVVFSWISGSSRTLHIFSHVLLVIIHKPGKQVSTLKAYAIMRLSSFAYRITTQDWENLSALHFQGLSQFDHVVSLSTNVKTFNKIKIYSNILSLFQNIM